MDIWLFLEQESNVIVLIHLLCILVLLLYESILRRIILLFVSMLFYHVLFHFITTTNYFLLLLLLLFLLLLLQILILILICNRAGFCSIRENQIRASLVEPWFVFRQDQTRPDIFKNRAKTCTFTYLSSPTKKCIFETKVLDLMPERTHRPVSRAWKTALRKLHCNVFVFLQFTLTQSNYILNQYFTKGIHTWVFACKIRYVFSIVCKSRERFDVEKIPVPGY